MIYYTKRHRVPEDHACTVPSPKKQGQGRFWNPFAKNANDAKSERKEKEKNKNKDKDKNKKKKNKKNKKLDPSKNRIRLKQEAVGNSSISSEDRFYLEISFSSGIKKKGITMFFNKKKTVGRILDEICDKRNIKNKNHIPTARVKFLFNINY